jgi:hypothetical protein
VAARSKVWVCGRMLAGIAGSNPVGGVMSDSLRLLFVVKKRALRRADHTSRGVRPFVVYLSVIVKPR